MTTATKTSGSTPKLSPAIAKRFEKARFQALQAMPYFATALLSLVPVEADIKTLAVDARWRLYLGRKFCAPVAEGGVDDATLAFGLLHEVGHVIRSHADRYDNLGPREARNHDLWNRVGDAVINDALAAAGCVVPDWAVTHANLQVAHLDGQVEEVIYRHLQDQAQDNDQSDSGDESGDGDGQGDESGDPSPGDDQGQGGDGQCSGHGDDEDDSCGSGAGGPVGDYELPADAAPGLSPGEADITRRKVAEDIIEASKTRGTVPGSLTGWAEATLAPAQVPWNQLLRSALRGAITVRAGFDDYSRRRPSRRNGRNRFLRPGRVGREAKVGVVIDTSGSMTTESIAQAANEILGLTQKCRVTPEDTAVYLVDAAVADQINARTVISDLRNGKVNVSGRGGTDMRVGIDAALAHDPDVVVVYTDGETPWPVTPLNDGRTDLIIILDNPDSEAECPEWATVVVVDQD